MTTNNRHDDRVLLFLHIQKTAGMTLQELLRGHCGPGLIRRVWRRLAGTSGQGCKLDEALRRLKPSDRLFMGHFCHGVHRVLDRPFTYLTFFRDPVARLVSLYHYSANTPAAHYHSAAAGKSISEFLLQTPVLELDNGMTRFIAGDDQDFFINRTPYGKCDEQLLERAIENLERHFSFVGLQERFDESVLLLGKVLHWPDAFYLTLNRGKARSASSPANQEMLNEVRARNALDYRLYAYAEQRFAADFARAFPDGAEALARFRQGNAAYQRRALPLYRFRTGLSSLFRDKGGKHGD